MLGGGEPRVESREFASVIVERGGGDAAGPAVDGQPSERAAEGRSGIAPIVAQVTVLPFPAAGRIVRDEFDDGAIAGLVGVGDVKVDSASCSKVAGSPPSRDTRTMVVPSSGRYDNASSKGATPVQPGRDSEPAGSQHEHHVPIGQREVVDESELGNRDRRGPVQPTTTVQPSIAGTHRRAICWASS